VVLVELTRRKANSNFTSLPLKHLFCILLFSRQISLFMKSSLFLALFLLSLLAPTTRADEFETELIHQINIERGKQKLSPLKTDA